MCLCSLEFVLETIARKWSLLIIDEIDKHKKLRYNDLQSELRGISPSTLSAMLRKLEDLSLIERKAFNEIPPRVEYSLSKKGKEFQELIRPLIDWAIKNDGNNIHCKCSLIKQDSHNIAETSNENLNR